MKLLSIKQSMKNVTLFMKILFKKKKKNSIFSTKLGKQLLFNSTRLSKMMQSRDSKIDLTPKNL